MPNILLYTSKSGYIKLDVSLSDETVWLTQRQLNAAPNQAMRQLIRLAERYATKRALAGQAWRGAKTAQRLGQSSLVCEQLHMAAKHLSAQRNLMAHTLVKEMARQGMVDFNVPGLTMDMSRLTRDSQQHVHQQSCSEDLVLLSEDATLITKTLVRGNTDAGALIIQRGHDTSPVYIAYNLLDANAIAEGYSDATIFMTFNGFAAVASIGEVLTAAGHLLATIVLVTDNFSTETTQRLYALSEPLREQHDTVMIAPGRLSGDYSHVRVHEALLHKKTVRGISYIEQRALHDLSEQPTAIQGLLSHICKRAVVQPSQTIVKRPSVTRQSTLYYTMTAIQRTALIAYLDACDQLLQHNTYADDIAAAKAGNVVQAKFTLLFNDVRHHSQYQQLKKTTANRALVKAHFMKQTRISVTDIRTLIRDLTHIKLDTQTCQQLCALTQRINNKAFTASDKKAIGTFLSTHAELIDVAT